MDSTNRDREKTPVENEPCSLKSYQEKEDQPLVETLLQTRDLEVCNWEELQEKYANAMDEHSRFEDNLRSQIAQLLQVSASWSQVTVLQDEDRALKRFKTQMQHVQNSEEKKENKKKHYIEVVKAFESALALLNQQIKL